MNTGELLLYLAFLMGSLHLIMLPGWFQAPVFLQKYSRWYLRLSAASLASAALLMVYYFLTSDFSVHYVYSYSSLDLAPIYKLSAFWTGEEGSMLFLTLMMLLVALYWSEKSSHKNEVSIILALGLLLLLLAISLGPFTTTLHEHPQLESVPEDGLGLNPLLINIWMVFHPPGIFIGYALMVAVFATAIIQKEGWESRCRGSARWAWLILSAGIISGCIWSYDVWESYWIWDPAFTSSLMVWLLLTAYLHTSVRYRKNGDFSYSTSSLGIIGFVMALYSTYIIRSGTIQSVHSFGEGEQNILLLYMVVVLFILSLGLIIKRAFIDKNNRNDKNKPGNILSDNNLFLLTTLLFLWLSAVLFTGLSYSLMLDIFGSDIAVSVALFNEWSYPMTALLLIVMGLCMFRTSQRRFVLILPLITVIMFILVNITENIYNDISATVIIFSGFAGLYRIGTALNSSAGFSTRIKTISPHLVHLGITVVMLGILMSTYSTSETIYFRSFNEKKTVADYDIELVDLAFPVQHDHYIATLSKIGTYNIYKRNGSLVSTGNAVFVEKGGEYTTKPYIYRGLMSDVRITYQGIGTTTPIFISFANIRVVPGVTILWAGCSLVLIGIIIKIFFRQEDILPLP